MEKNLLIVFFPEEITLHFEIKGINEKRGYIRIFFEELPELVPPMPEGTKGLNTKNINNRKNKGKPNADRQGNGT